MHHDQWQGRENMYLNIDCVCDFPQVVNANIHSCMIGQKTVEILY